MTVNKEQVKKNENVIEADSLEIVMGEHNESKYVTLPLSYCCEFSLVDDDGKSLFTISNHGTVTTVKAAGSVANWRLKAIKKTHVEGTSNGECVPAEFHDPSGTPATPIENENTDGFVDWLTEKVKDLDGEKKDAISNARRKIVFQSEG
ncbi:MAG: hypothetical protein GY765_14620 [bacterium]|nr:hypothetical protein [bacterium]